ncbi:MAG TPA: ribosome biogenesis GTP-binding protein YihA/YsxC [Burkholderiaceae bacterium]|nr:ribosome biogenesis GTP-binding protein YihA/YsxC [Burkholderiaceae bacterium]
MSLFQSARFVTSVAAPEQLNAAPLTLLPELAFVGRSNAGKSSVINVLANQRQLAFASKTPGRTQMLNFFELLAKDDEGERVARAYLVDLPGYGFARVDGTVQANWDALAGGYLSNRRCLAGVVLVMDARRPLLPADLHMLDWIVRRPAGRPIRVHLLLNKADQLSRAERNATWRDVEQRAAGLPLPISRQFFSALEREGVDELRTELHAIIDAARF